MAEKEKDKQTNNTQHSKLKTEQNELHQKPHQKLISCTPEG